MRIKKSLGRVYVGSYFVWIFCALLTTSMATKYSDAFRIVLFVFAVLDLAALIVARVFATKDNLKVPYIFVSAGGLFVLAIYVLLGLIFEIILTGQGQSAVFPWIIFPLGVVAMFFMLWVYIHDTRKRIKKIKSGKAKSVEEETPIEDEDAKAEAINEAVEAEHANESIKANEPIKEENDEPLKEEEVKTAKEENPEIVEEEKKEAKKAATKAKPANKGKSSSNTKKSSK